jgi:hypothetical protein
MKQQYSLGSKEELRIMIRKKLRRIMKRCIGKENELSLYDLFIEIFEETPEKIGIFESLYWMEFLRFEMRRIRAEGEIFMIIGRKSVYVLQSKEELSSFENKADNMIKNLEELKKKARKWVNEQQWRNL